MTNEIKSLFDDRFSTLRGAVELREQRPDDRQLSKRIPTTVEEVRALLDIYDAAREAAEWHGSQGTKHITDVRLWEAVTGRQRRAESAVEVQETLAEQETKWNRAYDEAMQWRDWQTCDILLDERETAEWYLTRERDDD